jgi:hypothetical protein
MGKLLIMIMSSLSALLPQPAARQLSSLFVWPAIQAMKEIRWRLL